MNIAHIDYSLITKSLDIYVSGCNPPHCKSCHNPELWDFGVGYDFHEAFKKIDIYIHNYDKLINKIMIFGGEPLDQPEIELDFFLFLLKGSFDKQIWLFTKYDIVEVPDFVKESCDYIKCGRYIEELRTKSNLQYGINLMTNNQKIYRKGEDY